VVSDVMDEVEVEEGEVEGEGEGGQVEVVVKDSNEGLGTVEKSACRIEVSALISLISIVFTVVCSAILLCSLCEGKRYERRTSLRT